MESPTSFLSSRLHHETMQNLRTCLEKLGSAVPGQLIRDKEPVDWRYGVTARVSTVYNARAVAEDEKKPGNPALLLENIKGYKMPVLINLIGARG